MMRILNKNRDKFYIEEILGIQEKLRGFDIITEVAMKIYTA
jgi:hypothetical protein